MDAKYKGFTVFGLVGGTISKSMLPRSILARSVIFMAFASYCARLINVISIYWNIISYLCDHAQDETKFHLSKQLITQILLNITYLEVWNETSIHKKVNFSPKIVFSVEHSTSRLSFRPINYSQVIISSVSQTSLILGQPYFPQYYPHYP